MSSSPEWIPEMARREPGRTIALSYQVAVGASLPVDAEQRISKALASSSLKAIRDDASNWTMSMPWQTRVFGLIPRDVDEIVTLHLVQRPDLLEVVVRCRPLEIHGAHATGVAAVLFIAISVWVATGLVTGLAAAATTIIAGALVVEFTRQWAFDAFERRLRRLVGDIGGALWPGKPAQIVEFD